MICRIFRRGASENGGTPLVDDATNGRLDAAGAGRDEVTGSFTGSPGDGKRDSSTNETVSEQRPKRVRFEDEPVVDEQFGGSSSSSSNPVSSLPAPNGVVSTASKRKEADDADQVEAEMKIQDSMN